MPVGNALQAQAGPQPGAFAHRYWRFNEETQRGDPGYPKPISVWQGIPVSPKGAFLSNDAGTKASTLPSTQHPPPSYMGQGLPEVSRHCDGIYGGTQLCQALGCWAFVEHDCPGPPCIVTIPFLQTAQPRSLRKGPKSHKEVMESGVPPRPACVQSWHSEPPCSPQSPAALGSPQGAQTLSLAQSSGARVLPGCPTYLPGKGA